MEFQLQSVEPELISLSCRGVLSQPLHSEASDPLRGLVGSQAWAGAIVLDMHMADYIDSMGIAWLLQWQRQAQKAGGVFCLCSVPPRINDTLRLCQLQRIIPIYENEATARTALAARSQPRNGSHEAS